ncbi:ABC transporter substrate-binding protein [Gordonia insulae]|uniref:Putative siderophore-binding lipoprotein YfiY n=1 Tax=Gordonia insulae TaxID=2420509 RepID=A0A3G8JVG8_9ACTN|nr:ABC transporter substrate-binding protein [Gordonia insulae]AZG48785.1 putative siderophore-binding lipoprotein YfiY [Gordonia insulae]
MAAAVSSLLMITVVSACSDDAPLTTPDGSPVSTVTTRVAEVNIVNADRDLTRTCLTPTAPDAGVTDVNRIVVTDPSLLDAVCALGIGPKVVAVAATTPVPAYLGPQLSSVPAIGARPDAAAVATAAPDIVLTTPQTAATAAAFGDAQMVTIEPGENWQERFQSVADALGRSSSGERLLDEYRAETVKTGRRMDAQHSQVSLVRFTGDSEMIAGTDTFAGQILAEIGVQRPEAQRSPQSFTVTDKNFTDADADLIYVSFQGDRGQAHGEEVLLSDRWLDMGAPTWKRVLAVDDDLWYGSSGLAAAWLVLNDVKESLDGNS